MTAYTFTPINISQPIGSDVYVAADGIDAAGEVVGSYGYTDGDDDSYFHGFTATGSVGTTFDPPGSSNTNGIGITASGEIFGSYVDWENRQHGFVYSNGAFQQIDVLLASSTIVDGVTNAGTIFGTYVDEFGFGINGFIDNNGSFTILDVPGASTTSISGLNSAGEIVGTYTDASGQAHGFADINGTFATIDPAGSISTSVAGVSATGEVAGNYENSSSVNNGFIDNNGVITTIVIPGATETGVSAINDAGEVVGYYADSLGNVHGFIEQNGVTTTIDVPGATETDINGVSDSGIITGFYNDSSYTQHGFVGVPEGLIVDGTLSDAPQVGSPVALLTGATISDPGKANLASATIRIANGGGSAVAGDQLFVNGQQSGTVAGGAVAVSWNPGSATLTLTGTASLATYQTLLDQVTYRDTGTDASSGSHPQRTVTWTVNDGTQNLVTTSQITIDRAPVASNDTGLGGIGTPLVVGAGSGVLANDSDLDGDTLTVTAVAGQAANVGASIAGSYGHLTLNANGSYSYVANNGAAAGSVDSFAYTVSDGNGGSATATLKITLDSPLQTLPLAVLTLAGQATPSGWTVSASGGDGGLTYTLASAAAHGTATVNANGTFGYTPAAGYSGTDSFQFKATDALGLSSVNTVSVGVGSSGYQVAQSLQLTASQSQYLSQAPAMAGSQTTWTWSGWVNLSSATPRMTLFSTQSGSGAGEELASLRLSPTDQLEFYDYSYTSSSYVTNALLETSQSFSANTWYQVTLVYDSTQAVAANRLELFVNGQQITSFASGGQVDPTQNFAGVVGSAAPRYLGVESGSSLLNGSLADVQFIDGQGVSASALGQTINGQWQPIDYTGSYGTNGYHLTFAPSGIGADVSGNGNNWTPVNLSAANVSAQSPSSSVVQLAQSLQLTASQSQYLSQAPAMAGSQTTWTWSGWVNLSSATPRMTLFSTQSGSGAGEELASLRLSPTDQLEFYDYSYTSSSYVTNALLETSQSFSANTWYQVTLVYDSTQAVAANRLELFVNGQQITSFASGGQVDPTQNFAGVVGSAAPRYLGVESGSSLLNGSLADVQFIDGQGVSASALGQTINGQWQPIDYTGSYGTNGYHLTFAPSGIGADVSGNGNNWTPVNLSAANVSAQSPGGSGAQVALTLDNGLAVNNGSSDQLSGATVRITGGFAGDGDVLSINTGGTGITASWNAANETLTLAGTDSAANYRTVLDTVVFSSGASDPTNAGANPTRTATWQVTDATNGTPSTAQSETIDLSPAYTTGGSHAQGSTFATSAGPITVDNGSTVEIGAPSASGIVFAGTDGTLQLDQSSIFGGQISGFGGQDQIDLRDIGFDANATLGYAPNAGNTGGTLSAADGSHIADIALLGSYMASSFAATSDGYGGTLVTDQATPSNQQTSFLATPTQLHA